MQSSITVGPIDITSEEHADVRHHTPPSSTTVSTDTDNTSNKDDNTQSGTNDSDVSNDTNDVMDTDIEIMKRELERYVSRSPPYNPAAGNKVRNPPRSQGLATDAAYRSSGAPGASKGRPPAVTANAGTTAQPKRR